MRKIFLLEAGINNIPDSWRDWPNRAIPWFHENTDWFAQSVFYACSALDVFVHEKRRTQSFADLVTQYAQSNWQIDCAGHSNGTRVIVGGLQLAKWPQIQTLHLICGACGADFERNGLNGALKDRRIKKVFCYVAGQDWAMRVENLAGKGLFNIGWKDQPLGLHGPKNVADSVLDRVQTILTRPWDQFEHSGCWLPCNFDRTLRQVSQLAVGN
jgi:hypothetical protein